MAGIRLLNSTRCSREDLGSTGCVEEIACPPHCTMTAFKRTPQLAVLGWASKTVLLVVRLTDR